MPKAIRDKRKWTAGTELVVEDTPAGVLLTRAPRIAPTEFTSVRGRLPSIGHTVSLEEMDRAVLAEARRRFAHD